MIEYKKLTIVLYYEVEMNEFMHKRSSAKSVKQRLQMISEII